MLPKSNYLYFLMKTKNEKVESLSSAVRKNMFCMLVLSEISNSHRLNPRSPKDVRITEAQLLQQIICLNLQLGKNWWRQQLLTAAQQIHADLRCWSSQTDRSVIHLLKTYEKKVCKCSFWKEKCLQMITSQQSLKLLKALQIVRQRWCTNWWLINLSYFINEKALLGCFIFS